jgi:hypothetical protein
MRGNGSLIKYNASFISSFGAPGFWEAIKEGLLVLLVGDEEVDPLLGDKMVLRFCSDLDSFSLHITSPIALWADVNSQIRISIPAILFSLDYNTIFYSCFGLAQHCPKCVLLL